MSKNELTKIDSEIITARNDLSVVEQGKKPMQLLRNMGNYYEQ